MAVKPDEESGLKESRREPADAHWKPNKRTRTVKVLIREKEMMKNQVFPKNSKGKNV